MILNNQQQYHPAARNIAVTRMMLPRNVRWHLDQPLARRRFREQNTYVAAAQVCV
jgi:hypothetical protein